MVRHDLPIVAVINNNGGWTGGPNTTPGRSLGQSQRYHDVVEALGGHGELVTKPEEIRPAIERAFASGKPACVHVIADEHARASTVPFGGYSTMMQRE